MRLSLGWILLKAGDTERLSKYRINHNYNKIRLLLECTSVGPSLKSPSPQGTSGARFWPASKWPRPSYSSHRACFGVYLYSSESWPTAQAPVKEVALSPQFKSEFPRFYFLSLTKKKYPKLGIQRMTSRPVHDILERQWVSSKLVWFSKRIHFVWFTIYYR